MYSDVEDEVGVYYHDRHEVHSDPDMDAADLDDRAVAAKAEEATAAMAYYYRYDDEKSDFRCCFADVCAATAAGAGARGNGSKDDDGGDEGGEGDDDAAAAVTVKDTDTADANKQSAVAADDEHVQQQQQQQQQQQRYLGNVLDDADTALYPPRDPAAWQPALVHEGRPLQHSPASHFFMQHIASGALVLLPVSVLINRQEMRDKHSDLLVRSTTTTTTADGDDDKKDNNNNNNDEVAAVATPVDFAIGYLAGVATGWAMPRTTDAAVLDALKACYPGWRAATQDDMAMFMREFVARDGRDAAGRSHPLQRHLTWRMCSGELLAEAVAAAGGWAHVRLVALDVVAAYVLSQRAVPLPLEMAFATVTDAMAHTRSDNNKNDNNNDDNDNNNSNKHGSRQTTADDDATDDGVWHFFVHPGHVIDTDKACYNALHIHGVPFDKAAFLRRDYDVLARHLARAFVDDVHTIFVCDSLPTYKPATMQFQALRWLFAAAAATATTRTASEGDVAACLPIPPPASIRCFDAATVLGALQSLTAQHAEDEEKKDKDNAVDGGDGDVVDDDDDGVCSCVSTPCSDAAGADDGTCSYHERAQALWCDNRTLHCARRSAVHLRDRLRTAWAHAVAASATEDDVQNVTL